MKALIVKNTLIKFLTIFFSLSMGHAVVSAARAKSLLGDHPVSQMIDEYELIFIFSILFVTIVFLEIWDKRQLQKKYRIFNV